MTATAKSKSSVVAIEALLGQQGELFKRLLKESLQEVLEAEMDEALGRKPKRQPGTAEVEASVRALAEKVESLDPIGKPLKPSAPCKPPDMLGAPGAHPDPGRNC